MRHRVDHRKLGRTAAHRKAMLSNMVTSLFKSERITTTDAKAKEARRLAEKLITRAKKGYTAHKDGNKDVAQAHWRQAARYVKKTAVLRKLFEEIAPHYLERDGGYTRIIRLQHRLGDNAQEVMLELIDTAVTKRAKGDTGEGEAKADEKKSSKAKTKAKSKAEGKSKAKGKSKKTKAKSKTKTKTKSKSKTKAKSKAKAKTKTKTKSKAKAKKKTKE